MIGRGLPVWLPNGEILKSSIEKFALETEDSIWIPESNYTSSWQNRTY